MDAAPLADRLRDLIAREGPIPVARWMGLCNAHYYGTRDPFGRGGDFVTAPEISQMFGELIGLWCADLALRAGAAGAAWVELGPGRGTLAADAGRAMARAGFAPAVHFVETSPTLRAAQAARVTDAVWHEAIDTLPDDRPLLIVANEFIDALPVRQFARVEAGWRERVVGWTGEGFAVGVAGELTARSVRAKSRTRAERSEALRPRAGQASRFARNRVSTSLDTNGESSDLPDFGPAPSGSIAETCPDGVAIVSALSQRIARQGGALLLIDYGYAGPAFGDTLQAVRGHAFADPFADPGEADLTAHVDFTPLAVVARDAGCAVHGPATQGAFLDALGIAPRAAALARAAPARAVEIEAARARLAEPRAMGDVFKVLAVRAAGWPAPAGFG